MNDESDSDPIEGIEEPILIYSTGASPSDDRNDFKRRVEAAAKRRLSEFGGTPFDDHIRLAAERARMSSGVHTERPSSFSSLNQESERDMRQEKTKFRFRDSPGHAIAAFFIAMFLVGVGWWSLPMSFNQVEAGYVGVAVDKPYFIGKQGVRKDHLEPGRHLEWNTTKIVSVAATPLKQGVIIDDFVTKDNYRVDFKTNITFIITDAPELIKNWGLEFWSNNIAAEYANFVREEVRKYSLNELMSDHETLSTVDQAITAKLVAFIKDRGIPIRIITVSMGQATPNKVIFDQIEETARTVEQKKTFIERANAEEQRKESERQRALADKAYQDNLGITKDEHLRLQIVKMQTDACIKATSCYIGIDKIVNGK